MVGLAGGARRFWRNRSRGVRYVLATAAVVAGLVALALGTSPFWLTPVLQTQRPALEAALTRALGARVHIGGIAARVGWRPGLVLWNATIAGRAGPAVVLRSVRVDLSWLALSRGRVWPAFIGVTGARLNVRKTAGGLHVVGLPHRSGPPFDWRGFLAKMHAIRIAAAHIVIAESPKRVVALRGLDAGWANGIKYRALTVQATVPGICARCRVTVHFSGQGFSPQRFRGAVGIHAVALNLHAAAALAGRRRLQALTGVVNGRVWTDWRRGHPSFVGGKLSLAQVHVPANRFTRSLAIKGLSGRFSLKVSRRGFRFYAANLVSELAGTRSHARTVFVARRGRLWRVEADSLRLGQVAYIGAHLRSADPALARRLALKPVGSLRRFHLRLRLGPHWRYRARGRFSGLGLGRRQTGPRFAHAAGTFSVSTDAGHVVLSGLHGLVRGPSRVPGPLHVQALSAQLSWQKGAQGVVSWALPVFHLISSAGAVDAVASGARRPGASPIVLLDVALRGVDLSALKDLYPHKLHGHLRRWLTRTVRKGVITEGNITLKGPLDRFPFRRGGGLFQATLHVTHGRYRFLPHWPAARDLAVTVTAHDALLSVHGSGALGGVQVPALAVQAGPLGTPTGTATVRVQAQADLHDVLRLVLPHVRRGLKSALPQTISGAGATRLALVLHIPFSRRTGPLRLNGHVRFQDASLSYPLGTKVLRWRNLTGEAGFDDAGPNRAHLAGRLLGGPFTLALTPRRRGGLGGQAAGVVSAAHLKALLGAARRYVHGALAWHLHLVRAKKTWHVALSANLRRLAVRLPYPAGKAMGVPAVAHLDLASGPRGVFAQGAILRHLTLSYAHPRTGARGLWVGVGSARPPRVIRHGLAIGVRAGYLAVRPWLAFAHVLMRTHLQKPSTRALFAPRSLTAYIGSFEWGGRAFGTIHARFHHVGTTWAGVLEGPDVAGTVDWRQVPSPLLIMNLDHLVVPPATRAKAPAAPKAPGTPTDPHRLPAVRFTANSLTVDGHYIGRVAIDGRPYRYGFRFRRIWLVRPHASVTGHGRWTMHGGLPESLFTLVFKSQNLGDTLSAWGLPHQVAGGHMVARGTLNWPGGPGAFSLNTLEGSVRFVARHGRFVQVRQGAGKLLGIFNVDSIARYLTLDFSNIFGRGFAFDRIDGKLIAQGGVAKTKRIHIEGASADVVVSGQTDLLAKTFDLKVGVNPHIQNNVTLATGLIGGPIAGAVMLLMQKIFAHEISQGTRLTYYIKGPWSKPSVLKKTDKD